MGRKTPFIAVWFAAVTALVVGCSSAQKEKEGAELAGSGLSIVNVRISPQTVELNRDLQPLQKTEIMAEVVDFTSRVTDVKLRFDRLPIEVKMKKVGGSTWRGEIAPEVLKRLAIGSQTTTYEASIVAKNAEGKVAVTREPVEVAIKAPDLSTKAG